MTKLQTNTLEEMCELIVDCPHSTPKWTDTGHLVIRNQNIRNGRLDLSDKSFTNYADYLVRIRRAVPQGGDLIFTREAPMGEICQVPEGLECCVGQRQVLLRPAKGVSSDYLLYAMQSPFVRHQIFWNEGTGSTVSNVRIPVLKKLEIPRQGSSESGIAHVLACLDDKIELNRRMNETLEEMARALFRDWFVDFGPTRRQMEGATDPAAIMGHAFPPEKAATLAPLFPAKLGDDGLPEGWENTVLSERYKVTIGRTPPRKEKWHFRSDGNGVPWLSIRDLGSCGAFAFDTAETLAEASVASCRVPVVKEDTVLVSFKLTVGRVAIAAKEMATNEAIAHLSPTNQSAPTEYTYCWMKQFDYGTLGSTSSIANAVNSKTIRSMPILCPGQTLEQCYAQVAGHLLAKVRANTEENQTLAEMRDLLLPKLMSGEIRLKDVEATQVTDATKPTQNFATDLLGNHFLSPEQEEERDAVLVAATVKALQKDDLLVGNVRVMKGVYLLKRKQALSLADFQREAAGPYDRVLNHEIRGYARERSWIRETVTTSAKGDRISGNRPARKYSEVEPLIEKYYLVTAVDWLAQHFKGASREWMECVATVDVAIQELTRKGLDVTVANIKADIASDPEWKPKLSKPYFADIEIKRAVKLLGEIF